MASGCTFGGPSGRRPRSAAPPAFFARVRRVFERVLAIAALLQAASCSRPAQAASLAPLVASDGMVVTESPEASLVGIEVLSAGGGAIDAAVAVAFALAVTYPQAGNLGGGGFLIARFDGGESVALDFRETAPAGAERDMFLGPDGRADPVLSTQSLLATGVPGTVAGLAAAHERFGRLPWTMLLEPAIDLAQDGFPLDRSMSEHLARYAGHLSRHRETARVFLRGGDLYKEGEVLRQPELAATLRRIAEGGASEFYEGETARLLVAEMQRGGGRVTEGDLRSYRPVFREPLAGSYHGYMLTTMPPPSSGGIALLQMLGMLEGLSPGPPDPGSSASYHGLAEVMKRAFADRAEFLGDPEFTPLPVHGLLEPAYIDSLRRGIRMELSSRLPGAGMPRGAGTFYAATGGRRSRHNATPGTSAPESGLVPPAGPAKETTHFSIVDGQGNAVAVTYTLNTNYGTGITVTGAGFLLNNEMDDFSAAPGTPNTYGLVQGEANAVRPGARPLSSMTPAIVTRGDSLVLVLGSPGGPYIITSVLQTLLHVLDDGWDVQAAVDAPRVHHQWLPDTLWVEPSGIPSDVTRALTRMGHHVGVGESMGSVQAIRSVSMAPGTTTWGRSRDVLLSGASDSRRNGCAAGRSGERIVSRCRRSR